jgi:hypothetical protein
MARTYGAGLNTIGVNPYPPCKEKAPDFFECELCHRSIPSKHWPEHKNSKKHRAKEDEERRGKSKENFNSTGNTGYVVEGFGGLEGAWVQATPDLGGGSRGADDRACHGCNEVGHIKRDW